MRCLFINSSEISGNRIRITDPGDVHHLSRSLRSVPGDIIKISDGCGTVYEVRISSVSAAAVDTVIESRSPIDLESLPRVILAQGLIKSHRWELMIEKVTELGVSRVIPVISERSRRQCQYKTERWRKISREASQQSGRSTLVEIDRPTPLERVLSLIPPDSEKIILREPDTLQPLADYPEKISLTRKPVVVLAGPEGGWSEDERQWAEQAGFMPFNINRNTLRSETAAISAVGILTFFGLGIYCNRRLFSERKEVS